MFLSVLALARSYWKPLVAVSLLFILTTTAYVKGRRDCARDMDRAVSKELQRTVQEVQKERDRTDTIRDDIRRDREVNPLNDERDSCLLSNDPFSVDCLKGDRK